MISIERLEQLREEYRRAWMEHSNLAIANEGAMQALDAVIAEFKAQEQEDTTKEDS